MLTERVRVRERESGVCVCVADLVNVSESLGYCDRMQRRRVYLQMSLDLC